MHYTKKKYIILTGFIAIFVLFALCLKADLFLRASNNNSSKKIKSLEKSRVSNDYCFAYASDCRENSSMLQVLVDRVNADEEIDLLIFGGDILLDCSISEYRRFIDITDGLNVPMVVVPGNHEMKGLGKILFRYYFGSTYYTFSLLNDKFFMLNNSNSKGFGYLQKLWFKRRLEKTSKDGLKFVFFHVPLYDDRSRMSGDGIADSDPKEAQEVLGMLKENKISHVFMSHLHGYYTGSWNGVPWTISAGSGAVLHPEPRENSFFNFLKVKVNEDKFDIEVLKL